MDEKYLEILENVLLRYFEHRAFSIHGYQEESTCIEKEGNEWLVFDAERGNKFHLETSTSFREAAIKFFWKMTHNEEKIEDMTRILDEELRKLS